MKANESPALKRDVEREQNTHRAVFAASLPAARLAASLDVDVRALKQWVELALFQELKNAGLSLVDVAERLDISERKSQQLNKRLRENFMALHRPKELSRRIEFLLWSEPLSLARLTQVVTGASPAEVESALFDLESEGRVVRKRDGALDPDAPTHLRGVLFSVVHQRARRTGPDLASRIDAVRNFCGSICNTLYSRFFGTQTHAFARTVGFQILPERVPELEAEYERFFQRLVAFEEEASASDDAPLTLDLSICWAPHDEALNAVQKRRKENT